MNLRQLYRRIVGRPDVDPLQSLVRMIIENQQQSQKDVKETQLAMLDAVSKMGEAATKQADVLAKYLDLFKTPNDPQSWQLNESEENSESMRKSGFPVDGTDAEKAEFILSHLDEM